MTKEEDGERTNVDEINELFTKGHIILLFYKAEGHEPDYLLTPAGSSLINVEYNLEKKMAEFGMFSMDQSLTGKGLGGKMIRAVEVFAKENGCTSIQLEILQPRDWKHPAKVILDSWYQRLGYKIGDIMSFTSHYPDLAPLLCCECTFTPYVKDL